MSVDTIKQAAIIGIALAIGIILLQGATGFVPEQKLYGVEAKPRPRSTAANVLSGTYQRDIDAWFATAIGFRNSLVRLDNQLNFSVFGQVSREEGKERGRGTLLILGRDKYLFENEYVDSYNRRDLVPAFDLELKVLQLKQMQEYLAGRGVPVLFLITPSKATVYADRLDDRSVLRSRLRTPGNYERVLPLLERYGINYFDGHRFIADLRRSAAYPVFARSGSHWTEQTVAVFTQELVGRMSALLHRELRTIRVLSEDVSAEPRVQDGDLAWLANLYTPEVFYEKEYRYPHYDTAAPAGAPGGVLKVAMIGGSFCYQLINAFTTAKVANVLFSYYFKRVDLFTTAGRDHQVTFSPRDVAEFVRQPIDLLAGADVVVIETNEARLWDLGHGVLDAAAADIERRGRAGT